ncbi:uncharacterized protein BXZ73DRAFT_105139 [Epithele typhae]|uniref:uncharacterized protein n=1 Tax=Epithele typhae TaxID=378194 RepID=UPI002007F6E5|nr:uncharacterized protein BXZ73DRAFT_105139 [Epithele typhae]KAH9918744.1 hypothetical protein BXZ73DRAFT_105139 [Epithele typhae]
MGSHLTLQEQWVAVGAMAVVSYDHILTLDREIQYIWRRKITGASATYVVMRCSSLAATVFTLLNFFSWPGKSSPVRAFACLDRI